MGGGGGVNLYAQRDPGPHSSDQTFSPKPSTQVQEDTSSFRLELFNKCLSALASMNLNFGISLVNQLVVVLLSEIGIYISIPLYT